MTSFSGLVCPPATILVAGNPLLVTFDGLQKVAAPSDGVGVILFADGSGPFVTESSLAPLRDMMGCYTGISSFVSIPIGCGSITNSTDICTYTGSSPCSPPPPPPPSCATGVPPPAPACGPYGVVTVKDNGDGSSVCTFNGGAPIQNCTSNPLDPNKTCGSLNATVVVVIANERGLSASNYVEPNINQWLTNIGIANIVVLQGTLTVTVTHTPGSIPKAISPSFFTSLQQLDGLLVRECQDCAVAQPVPPTAGSVLISLPGLSSLFKINLVDITGYLVIQGTAFQDMSSFTGLTCPFGLLGVTSNTRLSSFSGLNGVQPGIPGLLLNANGSGPFIAADSLDGIKPMLGCPSPSIANYLIAIPVGCNQLLNTTAEVCNFNGTIPCSPPPPSNSPPPLPPPPPPSPPPPPAPLSCAVSVVPREPLCGPYTVVNIFDFGDGSSSCYFANTTASTTVQNCTGNPFNPSTTCGSVAADFLTVAISNQKNLSAANYVQPDINKWLQNIGFSTINVLDGYLTVQVQHSDGPIPPPIAPVFFNDLEEARGILVRECKGDCSNGPPPAPALTSLPGLSNVTRIIGGDYKQYLTVQGTAFQNLMSFKKLTCPLGQIFVLNNTKLSSFDGLQGIQPLPLGIQNITGTGSGPFLAANALDGIKPLLGCQGGGPASTLIDIPVGCNTVLSSPLEVCNFSGAAPCSPVKSAIVNLTKTAARTP
eukprot:jgi/Botrbrau1/18177/Bobra.53_1s0045.1